MDAAVDAFPPGYVVAGKYRLVEPIGRGGMGAVWRAVHVTLGGCVAVKLVDPKLLAPDSLSAGEVVRRFLREAQAAAAIRSPHVVQILDHGFDGVTPFMVLELLEGESLDARLDRVGTLDLDATARLVAHVARALTRAHDAGLVHRDLKPSNIFLVRNDDEEIAKVLDFGLVKLERPLLGNRSELTATGNVLGTPAYMSPEQTRGSVDFRADLYSLALIAFECLTGRLPFESAGVMQMLVEICVAPLPVPSTLADVPEGFDEWFAKAANRDVARRFSSAREMADSLRALSVGPSAAAWRERAAEGAAVRAPGAAGATSKRRELRPRRGFSRRVALGAALACVAVAFGGWVLLGRLAATSPGMAASPGAAPSSELSDVKPSPPSAAEASSTSPSAVASTLVEPGDRPPAATGDRGATPRPAPQGGPRRPRPTPKAGAFDHQ